MSASCRSGQRRGCDESEARQGLRHAVWHAGKFRASRGGHKMNTSSDRRVKGPLKTWYDLHGVLGHEKCKYWS